MKFRADNVEYWSHDGRETVFFGHQEKELALLISNISGTPDHYLEWNDQSNACINAVKTIQLSGNELQIHLRPEAAKRLGVSDFVIAFTIAELDLKKISQYLSRIFGNQLIIKRTDVHKKAVPKQDYSRIKYLNLEGKNLKTLPDYVSEMTSLETAKLARNPRLNFHGVCEVLAKLPLVKELTFTTNQEVPANISQLTTLESLSLNGFTSPQVLPESIGLLKNLNYLLILSDSDVILPESFADLVNLTALTIRAESWQLPSKFYRLSKLKLLDFYNCRFTHVPEEMAGMNEVDTLYFSSPDRRDYSQILPVVAQMPNLKELELNVNPVPKEIGLCKQIEKLVLWAGIDSRTSLQLPDELFELQQLKTLIFNMSYFDEIPAEIGRLKGLEQLVFIESDFERLPDSVGELSNLTYLNVSENPSLRVLPKSLGNLTKLKHLYLSDNPQLTNLPDSLKNLTNPETVRISTDKL
ncbi:leucine-rich repeat domain-containing protein [Runella sp.]|uniref:leucine-rich repeat domain-containing protein n=1 Tax=Runella sp. TaxID=1960881 RepID=UPI003D0EF5E7